jgi:signal transduction histidine kinase
VQVNDLRKSPAEVWLELLEALLGGISHGLNNRLAAISSLVQVLSYGGDPEDPLQATLRGELETLERTLALLRVLPRESEEPSVLLRLVDVLPDAIDLQRLRTEFRDLDLKVVEDGDALPVQAEPTRILHAFLLLLDLVGKNLADRAAPITVGISGDQERVSVAMNYKAGQSASLSDRFESEVEFLRGLLRDAGGRVIDESGSPDLNGDARLTIQLPTVLALRRQGSR